jgi:hypothetical protein
LLWLRKDYEPAVKLLREHANELAEGVEHEWWYVDRLVRSLVRLGKPADAAAVVRARDVANFDTPLLVLAYAATGDLNRTIEAIQQCIAEDYTLVQLYDDDDLGPILKTDALRSVREKFPHEPNK